MSGRYENWPAFKKALHTFWHAHEQWRFVAMGVANTVFGYLVFATFYALLGEHLHYLVVATFAHISSVSWAFYWHRRLVFHSAGPWPAEFVRYNIGLLGVFLGGMALLALLVSVLKLHPLAAQAIIIPGLLIVSYFTHRHFSFR